MSQWLTHQLTLLPFPGHLRHQSIPNPPQDKDCDGPRSSQYNQYRSRWMFDADAPNSGQDTDLDGDGSCSVSAYTDRPQYSSRPVSYSVGPSMVNTYNIFRNRGCPVDIPMSAWYRSQTYIRNRCSTGQFLPGTENQVLCCKACPANTYQSSTSHTERQCNDQPTCRSDQYMSEDTKNAERTCSSCPAGTVQRATSHRETQCVDTTSTTTTTTTTATKTTVTGTTFTSTTFTSTASTTTTTTALTGTTTTINTNWEFDRTEKGCKCNATWFVSPLTSSGLCTIVMRLELRVQAHTRKQTH